MDLQVNTSHYNSIRSLGKGAFGEVFQYEKLEEYSENNEPKYLAVKKCAGGEKEIKIMKSIPAHPNIVRCLAFILGDMTEIYLEFCDTDMKRYMTDNRGNISHNPLMYMTLSRQMVDGLAHIHSHKICHRDLKPENILIKFSGHEVIPKLADFGISRLINFDETQTTTIAGTVKYMSPEMRDAFLEGTTEHVQMNMKCSDVYSMGLILLFLLTKDIPEIRRDESKTCSIVSERFSSSPLCSVVIRMLEEEPKDRPKMLEVVEHIRTYQVNQKFTPIRYMNN